VGTTIGEREREREFDPFRSPRSCEIERTDLVGVKMLKKLRIEFRNATIQILQLVNGQFEHGI
jgi:hypothetical protein